MSYKDIIGKEILSENEISARVAQLAREIEDHYLPGPLAVMPIFCGSCIFAADLIRHMRIPLTIHPILMHEVPEGIYVAIANPEAVPEHVLIIDDLVDSGTTLIKLGEFLSTNTKVKTIRVCTLLHKHKVPMDKVFVNWVGFKIPDIQVIGYGADHNGLYRNCVSIREVNVKTTNSGKGKSSPCDQD